MNDFNAGIIEEFRANQGKVGGPFEGASMILLHTTGAKSGETRVNPVVYRREGDDVAIFASYAGRPENPAWYYNLLAHPDVEVELGAEQFAATARVAEGDERERIWEAQKRDVATFAEYEAKTDRTIPVVVLERVV